MRFIPKLENSILNIYYLVILTYLLAAEAHLRIFEASIPVPVDPHFIISFIPVEIYGYSIKFFSALAVISLTVLIFNPWIRTLRILSLISWLVYFAHVSSFGKSINDQYAATFSMLTLIFLPSSKDNQIKIDQVIVLAKFQAVMCYAMAGLWKIRTIPMLMNIGELVPNLSNAIAMEYMKYGRAEDISAFSLFFMDRDYLTFPMYLGLVLLQTTSPLMVFNRKAQIFFGVMITIFHILSEVMLSISFRYNMYLMMILFLYDPLIRMYLDRKSRLSNL